MVARVLVEIKAKSTDHTFDYNIPLELSNKIQVGKRVLVPFAKQTLEGFVMGITNDSEFSELKDIIDVIDEEAILNEELLKIGDYISKKTLSTKICAYQSMLPKALRASKKTNINKKYDTYIRLIDRTYLYIQILS